MMIVMMVVAVVVAVAVAAAGKKTTNICSNAFAPWNRHRHNRTYEHTRLLDVESVSCNLTPNMDTPELSTLKSMCLAAATSAAAAAADASSRFPFRTIQCDNERKFHKRSGITPLSMKTLPRF